MKVFRQLSISCLTVVLSVALLGASGDRARFTDLGHRMMCVCGCNQILLECNHVGCTYSDRMREQLLAATQRESSDENILQTFVKEYGTTVLAAPTMRGFDRVAWIMPFAVFLAGALMAVILIRNWKARQPAHAGLPGTTAALDTYRDQARRETFL
ncbi:MAG TPA: cytochrome c-type biogenesis protein CcmH [Terriglobales bacterium]|jgi:cytochrome c-type biogenesis protein CcmH/NrfF|nr:cytochrome c-type biogenesis protein CcmH [Terriglobales bacterium]